MTRDDKAWLWTIGIAGFAVVCACGSPQQTIRTALPVARTIVDLAEAVCVATDSAENCLTKCQIEAQRRSAEKLIQEVPK